MVSFQQGVAIGRASGFVLFFWAWLTAPQFSFDDDAEKGTPGVILWVGEIQHVKCLKSSDFGGHFKYYVLFYIYINK